MTGPAVIVFANSMRGRFVAEKARLERDIVTARGRFERKLHRGTRQSDVVTRSWPMDEIREVRWGSA